MKKGSYYFGLLTDGEKKNYKEAVDILSKKGSWDFDKLMDFEFRSLDGFIRWSFILPLTTQGHDYWQNIANSNRENIEG